MAETLIGKLEDIAAVHRGRGAHRDCRVHDRFEPDCWFCQVTVIEDTIAALSQREASREAQGWLIDRAEVMLMSRSYPPNAENIAADLDARTQLGYDLLAAIRAAPAPEGPDDPIVARRILQNFEHAKREAKAETLREALAQWNPKDGWELLPGWLEEQLSALTGGTEETTDGE